MTVQIAERAGLLGLCVCPICKSTDAEVIQGKRMPHIVCEDCGSLIQSRTKRGGKLIAAMIRSHKVNPPDDPPPVPAPAPTPKPAAPKKSSSLAAMFGIEE
jgi:hypothetical protein